MDPRGQFSYRDNVVAACLVGTVVVVVGYASGLGLRSTSSSTELPPAAAAPAHPGVPLTAPPVLPPAGLVPGPAVIPPQPPVHDMPPIVGAPSASPTLPATTPGPQDPPGHGPGHPHDPDHPHEPPPECQESLLRTLIDVLPVPGGGDPDGLPLDPGALPLDAGAVDATGLSTSALDTSALGSTEANGPVEDTLGFIAGSCETSEPEPTTSEPGTTTTEPTPSHTGHGG